MDDNYTVLLSKNGETFLGRIPELTILVTARDLSSLWEQIESQKQEKIRAFKEVGLEDDIPVPFLLKETPLKESALSTLPNWMKFGSILLGSLVFILALSLSFKTIIFEKTGITKFIIQRLNNLAEHLESMPSKKREKLHEKLQTIAREGQPFIRDLRPLLEEFSLSGCSEELPMGQLNDESLSGKRLKN